MKYSSWKIPNKPTPRPKAVLEAGYSPLLAALLGLRGIEDPVEAERFLCGSIKCLTDPMQMVGMSDAVSRVKRAIEGREQVAVFGDYDVDGISSTALIVKYLRSKGVSCKGYIPDRLDEGYGLNKPALKSIYESGASLVITVDCGIMACEEAEYAAELGLDMVITDHHECNMSSLPKACADFHQS